MAAISNTYEDDPNFKNTLIKDNNDNEEFLSDASLSVESPFHNSENIYDDRWEDSNSHVLFSADRPNCVSKESHDHVGKAPSSELPEEKG